MNREQVKRAADALGRLEALEKAIDDMDRAPHGALPISFFSAGEDDSHQSDHGIKAYYPRERYSEVLCDLINLELAELNQLGVER